MDRAPRLSLETLLADRHALLEEHTVGAHGMLAAGTLVGSESGPVDMKACARVTIDGSPPRGNSVGIVYSAIVGSRAQGLDTSESDTDRRGIYIASSRILLGLSPAPEQLVHDADQVCYWEIRKCLALALKANPTVLETLYSPAVEFAAPFIRDRLESLKESGAFLSRRAHQTFLGYANAQFEKMQRSLDVGKTIKWQHAMHLIRLLRAGIALMRTGRLETLVPEDERAELHAIKRGERTWEEVARLRSDLVQRFGLATSRTSLPAHPDTSEAEQFLIEIRLLCAREEWA